ncbi:hypothetical protein FB451DRAFT_1510218, partial [Mycena latifolia]
SGAVRRPTLCSRCYSLGTLQRHTERRPAPLLFRYKSCQKIDATDPHLFISQDHKMFGPPSSKLSAASYASSLGRTLRAIRRRPVLDCPCFGFGVREEGEGEEEKRPNCLPAYTPYPPPSKDTPRPRRFLNITPSLGRIFRPLGSLICVVGERETLLDPLDARTHCSRDKPCSLKHRHALMPCACLNDHRFPEQTTEGAWHSLWCADCHRCCYVCVDRVDLPPYSPRSE